MKPTKVWCYLEGPTPESTDPVVLEITEQEIVDLLRPRYDAEAKRRNLEILSDDDLVWNFIVVNWAWMKDYEL